MLKETAMVSVLLALLLLNIITPTLLGQGESDIGRIPMVLLDADESQVQIYIKGALHDTRYDRILIKVSGVDNQSYAKFLSENDSYATKQVVLLDDTREMDIEVLAYVGDREWWLNGSVRVEQQGAETTIWLSLEDEDGIQGAWRQEDIPFKRRLHLRR